MNKNNIISSVFVIVFILVFSWLEGQQFFEYSKSGSDYRQDVSINSSKLSEFSLESIAEIADAQFYYTPYTSLLDTIVWYINNSDIRVYVEVYMLTETRIKEALVRANKRWIDVRVILEKNPYKAYNINNKHFKYLEESGVRVVWSNPKNYSLNHAKFILVDNLAIVSTWNFTYSTFTKNRDLFITTSQDDIVESLGQIFAADFAWEKISIYHDNLVISPTDSREKFRILFEEAKESIDLYFQYIQDDALRDVLLSRAQEWIDIRLIVSEASYKEDEKELDILRDAGIAISYLDREKMHSKAILVDGTYLFIWSVNFSSYSLDANREIGFIFRNSEVIKKFVQLFEKDF